MGLKIAFMGTPEFSIPPLKALIEAGHKIVAVYTQPQRPSGRGKKLKPTAVEIFARENKLEVYAPPNFIDRRDIKAFRDLGLDVSIVAAYGLILPKEILEAPKFGCINVHASLLPRWRGAAPIHRAIMAGDNKSGITIMQMNEGLDTGHILLTKPTSINKSDTTSILHDRLSEMGGKCIISVLKNLEDGCLQNIPQPSEGVTYANKVKKSEARINWQDSAQNIDLKVRALNSFPGAWFLCGEDRIKILKGEVLKTVGEKGLVLNNQLTIGCSKGSYKVLRAQRSGKSPMDTSDLLRGYPINKGVLLDFES
ncbi:MAG: methionyl-tRNA formyltransferase [Sphingomonadales bacterium]|jgi:methionyl-tRNA formyltransferase